MSNRNIVKIIEQYCKSNSITLTKLSADWILKLTKNNQTRYIVGYQFELNSSATSNICLDKSATSEILSLNNIPNVHHELFMSPIDMPGNWEKMIEFLNTHKKIVCKINNGTGGKDVFFIDNIKSLEKAVTKIFSKDQYIALSPFYDIKNEYRAIILDSKVKLLYSKERQFVVGDGKSTILQLIANKFTNLKKIDLSELPISKILGKDEKFNICWKHNLGLGASPKIVINPDIYNSVSTLALSACEAVNGKFVSVDIIETDEGLKVLEINSGIMMENFSAENEDNYKIAQKIYGEAIEKMFNLKGEL